MARAIRKNVMLKLGALAAPVDLSKATDDHSGPKLYTACNIGHEPTRVKQRTACPTCDNDDYQSFVKVAKEDEDTYVVVADEVIASAGPTDSVRETLSLTAHPAEDVEAASMRSGRVYWLKPAKGAEEVYGLVRTLVTERNDVSLVCEFAVRGKSSMYELGVFGKTLTLLELARPDLIREAPDPETPEANDETITMLNTLVDKMAKPFDPHTYRDRRGEYLRDAVEAAANGEEPVIQKPAEQPSTSVNDLLKAALEDA